MIKDLMNKCVYKVGTRSRKRFKGEKVYTATFAFMSEGFDDASLEWLHKERANNMLTLYTNWVHKPESERLNVLIDVNGTIYRVPWGKCDYRINEIIHYHIEKFADKILTASTG